MAATEGIKENRVSFGVTKLIKCLEKCLHVSSKTVNSFAEIVQVLDAVLSFGDLWFFPADFLMCFFFFFSFQTANKNVTKVPPPVPTKPKQINLPYFGQASHQQLSDPKLDGNLQKLPLAVASVGSKQKPVAQQPSHPQQIQRISVPPVGPSSSQDQILSSSKQESPPAAAVRPFTPQPSKENSLPPFRKPQTVAASSIYSMYTQQQTPGKNFQQAVQSALTRAQTRAPHFPSGKLVALYLSSVFINLRAIFPLICG